MACSFQSGGPYCRHANISNVPVCQGMHLLTIECVSSKQSAAWHLLILASPEAQAALLSSLGSRFLSCCRSLVQCLPPVQAPAALSAGACPDTEATLLVVQFFQNRLHMFSLNTHNTQLQSYCNNEITTRFAASPTAPLCSVCMPC